HEPESESSLSDALQALQVSMLSPRTPPCIWQTKRRHSAQAPIAGWPQGFFQKRKPVVRTQSIVSSQRTQTPKIYASSALPVSVFERTKTLMHAAQRVQVAQAAGLQAFLYLGIHARIARGELACEFFGLELPLLEHFSP